MGPHVRGRPSGHTRPETKTSVPSHAAATPNIGFFTGAGGSRRHAPGLAFEGADEEVAVGVAGTEDAGVPVDCGVLLLVHADARSAHAAEATATTSLRVTASSFKHDGLRWAPVSHCPCAS